MIERHNDSYVGPHNTWGAAFLSVWLMGAGASLGMRQALAGLTAKQFATADLPGLLPHAVALRPAVDLQKRFIDEAAQAGPNAAAEAS